MYYFFFRIQVNFLTRRISNIVTFSDVGIKVLSNRFKLPKNKFKIIPLGYDLENFKVKKKLKNSSKKMIIGYAGKISVAKRVDYLIKVLNELDFNNNLKLIIVGYNKEDKYCKELNELGKKTNFEIEFRPFATPEELIEFYNYIDIAIYPGGVSITTIEASSCGTPVIIFESIDGLEERVSFDRGKLFKTKNELKTNIKTYFDLYKKDKIDNEYIAQKTKELFSWEKISKDYLQLYKKVKNKN